jgi:hypothetical protein
MYIYIVALFMNQSESNIPVAVLHCVTTIPHNWRSCRILCETSILARSFADKGCRSGGWILWLKRLRQKLMKDCAILVTTRRMLQAMLQHSVRWRPSRPVDNRLRIYKSPATRLSFQSNRSLIEFETQLKRRIQS